MKKTVKIGAVLLILGLLLTIFGIANNGIQSVYWDQGFHVLKKHRQTYHPDKINQLTLSTNADVIVKRGATTSIRVLSSRSKPTVTDHDGHITIKSPELTTTQGFILSAVTDQVVITVPAKTTLTKIKATTDQASVRLKDLKINQLSLISQGQASLSHVSVTKPLKLTADNVQLDQVTAPQLRLKGNSANINISHSQFTDGTSTVTTSDGHINLEHSQFKQVALSTVDGNLNVRHNQFDQAKISTADGHIELSNNQLAKRLTAKTNDGNIHVQTSRDTGIRAKTKDGNLSIFDQHQNGDQQQKVYRPTAKVQYQLSTDDGNINVSAS